MKSVLRSVTVLYLVFALAVLHLGYFLLNKQTENLVLFTLVCVFVYLNTKNMITVLFLSILFVDLISLVKLYSVKLSGSNEGFEDSSGIVQKKNPKDNTKDVSMNMPKDIPKYMPKDVPKDVSKTAKSLKESFDVSGSLFGLLKDASGNEPEPTRHLENVVRQLFKKTEPMIGDLEEVQSQSNEMSSVIEKIKKSSPEMADSMKMLNSIDIHEFNKLINNLNKIVNSVAE